MKRSVMCLSVLGFLQRHCGIEEAKKRNIHLLGEGGGGGVGEIESRGMKSI